MSPPTFEYRASKRSASTCAPVRPAAPGPIQRYVEPGDLAAPDPDRRPRSLDHPPLPAWKWPRSSRCGGSYTARDLPSCSRAAGSSWPTHAQSRPGASGARLPAPLRGSRRAGRLQLPYPARPRAAARRSRLPRSSQLAVNLAFIQSAPQLDEPGRALTNAADWWCSNGPETDFVRPGHGRLVPRWRDKNEMASRCGQTVALSEGDLTDRGGLRPEWFGRAGGSASAQVVRQAESALPPSLPGISAAAARLGPESAPRWAACGRQGP